MEIQPGSGCGRIKKEDLVDKVWLGQAKSTRRQVITLRMEDLNKVKVHAAVKDKIPVVFVGFVGDEIIDGRVWAMIPVSLWNRERTYWKGKL
jgi:hypothetical protein